MKSDGFAKNLAGNLTDQNGSNRLLSAGFVTSVTACSNAKHVSLQFLMRLGIDKRGPGYYALPRIP